MRSFWTASSSSTSRMVGGSGIRARLPDDGQCPPTYYSPGCRLPQRRGGAARGAARSTGRSAGARTAGRGSSSRSRSCWRRSPSTRPAALPASRAPRGLRPRRRDAARQSTSRARHPTGRRGRPARRWRRSGSWISSARTASSSGGTVSRPTSPGEDGFRSRISSPSCRAARPRRSWLSPIVTTRGAGSGANDNASGTAALIELARSYASPAGASTTPSSSRRVTPAHTLVFLSTDGGALGGIGAAHFAEHSPLARDVVRRRRPRRDRRARSDAARVRGRPARSLRAAASLATAAARVLEQGGDADTAAERAAPAPRPRLPLQRLRAGAVPRRGGSRR